MFPASRLGITRSMVAVALALSVWWNTAPAMACRCQIASIGEARQSAHAIFEGQVDHYEPIPNGRMFQRFEFVVRVLRAWRGVTTNTEVRVRSVASTCRMGLRPAVRYLIFARRRNGYFEIHRCGGTRPMHEVGSALRFLGPSQ